MATKVSYDDVRTQAGCFNTTKPAGLSVLSSYGEISIFSYLWSSQLPGEWYMV